MTTDDVVRGLQMLQHDKDTAVSDVLRDAVVVANRSRPVIPKSVAQQRYLDFIRNEDVVFGIGPAGTSKTYLAMAMAVKALLDKQVRRIVLCRPAVEAGEKLGFLPGTMQTRSIPICDRCTTRSTTCSTWNGRSFLSIAVKSRSRRSPLCADGRSTIHLSSSTKRRTRRASR